MGVLTCRVCGLTIWDTQVSRKDRSCPECGGFLTSRVTQTPSSKERHSQAMTSKWAWSPSWTFALIGVGMLIVVGVMIWRYSASESPAPDATRIASPTATPNTYSGPKSPLPEATQSRQAHWVTALYGDFVDKSQLTQSGGTVEDAIRRCSSDSVKKGELQPFLAPYSNLLLQVLDATSGPPSPPLWNIAGIFDPGRANNENSRTDRRGICRRRLGCFSMSFGGLRRALLMRQGRLREKRREASKNCPRAQGRQQECGDGQGVVGEVARRQYRAAHGLH